MPCDLAEIEKIPDLVKAVRKQFGPIYGLVNNAAIGLHGPLALMHNSQIEQLVQVNTLSPDRADQICGARDDGRWRRPGGQCSFGSGVYRL